MYIDRTVTVIPTEVLAEKVKTSQSAGKKQLFGELESAVPVTTFLYLAKLFAKNRQHIIDLATGMLALSYSCFLFNFLELHSIDLASV